MKDTLVLTGGMERKCRSRALRRVGDSGVLGDWGLWKGRALGPSCRNQ